MSENQEPVSRFRSQLEGNIPCRYKETEKRLSQPLDLRTTDKETVKPLNRRTPNKETEKRLSQGIKSLNLTYKDYRKNLDKLWGGLPDPNYRFQLFSICVHYNNDKPCKLYGYVEIDGSGSGFVSLFNCGPRSSKPIYNKGLVPLSSLSAVPATKYIKISSQIFVIEDDEDEDADEDDDENDEDEDEDEEEGREVLNELMCWEMSIHRHNLFDSCSSVQSNAKYGHSKLYYVLLNQAAEATMEVSFTTSCNVGDGPCGRNVVGKILAYYGNFYYDCSPEERKYYDVTLFEAESEVFLKTGKIPLKTSMLAVPYNCSLIIDARLWDNDSMEDIVFGLHKFPAQPQGSPTYRIEGNTGFNLDLKLDWKYEASGLELRSSVRC